MTFLSYKIGYIYSRYVQFMNHNGEPYVEFQKRIKFKRL